jgi:hypothetical protein
MQIATYAGRSARCRALLNRDFVHLIGGMPNTGDEVHGLGRQPPTSLRDGGAAIRRLPAVGRSSDLAIILFNASRLA